MNMRHIFHRILARYLDEGQISFDSSPRELWPEPRPSWHPPVETQATHWPSERRDNHQVYGELEPQN